MFNDISNALFRSCEALVQTAQFLEKSQQTFNTVTNESIETNNRITSSIQSITSLKMELHARLIDIARWILDGHVASNNITADFFITTDGLYLLNPQPYLGEKLLAFLTGIALGMGVDSFRCQVIITASSTQEKIQRSGIFFDSSLLGEGGINTKEILDALPKKEQATLACVTPPEPEKKIENATTPPLSTQRQTSVPVEQKNLPTFNAELDEGKQFVGWLSDGLRKGIHPLNTTEAFLHTTKEGLLVVSPRAFKTFSEHNWEYVQKRFTKLKLHKPAPNNSNIWLYYVYGKRKRGIRGIVCGFIIPNPLDTLSIPYLPQPNKSLFFQREQSTITPKLTETQPDDTLWIRLAKTNDRTVKPANINNNITGEIVDLHQQPPMPTPLVDAPPPSQESPDQDDTSAVGNLQDIGIPHPLEEPDVDTNDTLSIGSDGTITPTVITAEPDATDAWLSGFIPWLRQQMLDGKCPEDVVTVKHGLLVGNRVFSAFCRAQGYPAYRWWDKVRRKVKLSFPTPMTTFASYSHSTSSKTIHGILFLAHSMTTIFTLPQEVFPQDSGYITPKEKAALVKKVKLSRQPAISTKQQKTTKNSKKSSKPFRYH